MIPLVLGVGVVVDAAQTDAISRASDTLADRLGFGSRGSRASSARRRVRPFPSLRRDAVERGTRLYHGTSSEEDFTDLEGPAWLSTSAEVERRFVPWAGGSGPPRILVYEVHTRIFGLVRILDEADMARLRRAVDPDEDTDTPVDLAERVCAAGFSGWNVPHNYGYGASDLLLCDPMRLLRYVEMRPVRS